MCPDNTNGNITVTEISDPEVVNVISIFANGGVAQSAVNGIKGSGEETYRTGYVEISPENLGFNKTVKITEAPGVLEEASWKILKDNLSSVIEYNSNIYSLVSKTENTWVYESLKYSEDDKLVGSRLIEISTTDLSYTHAEADVSGGGVSVSVEEQTLVFGQ